ncbi:interleukin-12 receptor subunit beta-1-like [Heptranchias perlo]|uniref:interleukin-12 receptor subunit beta-1-like n=1 Tax=Heptranchias perlo TaxID=212740 RepID=UPI003559FE05
MTDFSYVDRLEKLRLFSLENRRSGGDLIEAGLSRTEEEQGRGTLCTQYCQEDEDRSRNVIIGASEGPSALTCYRQRSGDAEPLRCMWIAGKDMAEYKLCYCCDTCKKCESFLVENRTSYTVPRDNLYIAKNLTFWVESDTGGRRFKSEKLYIVPQTSIKYDPPLDKEIWLQRSSGQLTLSWEKPEVKQIFNEIRYRRARGPWAWNKTICVSNESEAREICSFWLESSAVFQLQIRRNLHLNGSHWSEWSKIIFVPSGFKTGNVFNRKDDGAVRGERAE